MTSLILQTATRFLVTLLVLFSVFLLLRGHNEPGGGFAGGLVAAAAFALYAIAYDPAAARRALRVQPTTLIAVGLTVALGSSVLSLLGGRPLATGLWAELTVPGFPAIYAGTPVLFDIGVYLVVLGITLVIVLALAEE